MKNWIIAFATEKFYVTEDDAKFYMQEIAKGTRFVALKNGMMLSDRALYVIPSNVIDDSKKLESGKWQCETGNWHHKDLKDCVCKIRYEIVDGKAVRVDENLINA